MQKGTQSCKVKGKSTSVVICYSECRRGEIDPVSAKAPQRKGRPMEMCFKSHLYFSTERRICPKRSLLMTQCWEEQPIPLRAVQPWEGPGQAGETDRVAEVHQGVFKKPTPDAFAEALQRTANSQMCLYETLKTVTTFFFFSCSLHGNQQRQLVIDLFHIPNFQLF
ncbi:uncharacterized protein LOC143695177 [Agelaius phoeniceus]|uniref:uncharacterized protein LOC143695177 n=1 Tax=Agelaius phoeniceus TaxID=39638 RepID=UPI004054C8F1